MEKKMFFLAHAEARRRAMAAVVDAPPGWVIEVKPPNRNNSQNALLHSLLSEIADQKQWAGQKWDVEDWKRLLTGAWARTQNQDMQIVPAVDGGGRFEVLYRRTSKLSKAECADLITFIQSWAVENGVVTHEHEPA